MPGCGGAIDEEVPEGVGGGRCPCRGGEPGDLRQVGAWDRVDEVDGSFAVGPPDCPTTALLPALSKRATTRSMSAPVVSLGTWVANRASFVPAATVMVNCWRVVGVTSPGWSVAAAMPFAVIGNAPVMPEVTVQLTLPAVPMICTTGCELRTAMGLTATGLRTVVLPPVQVR